MSEGTEVVVDLGEDCEWVVTMTWPVGVTTTGPRTLTIRPADPDGYPDAGISPALLRQISFGDAVQRLRRQLTHAERWSQSREQHEVARDDRIRAALSEGVTDTYLALLSSRYVSITNHGQPHPLRLLADITGKTESTIKGHLWQARKKRGLLEGSAGRSGGTLTAKANSLISQLLEGTGES